MKKGKYQVQMKSDDVYFARRQVDKLFEKLLKIQGKLRVVLPSIDSDKVVKETKELEKQSIINELTPDRLSPEEKKAENPVKIEEVKPVESAAKIKEVIEIPEEVIEKTPDPEIIKAPPPVEEVQEIVEIPVEIIKEETPETLFGNILAEKTLEINEDVEEEPAVQETQSVQKTFSFKNIITEKLKGSNSSEVSSNSMQKAEFIAPEIEEPEMQRVKPQEIVPSDDQEIAKILEEKIKRNLPQSENKTIFNNEAEEQEAFIENSEYDLDDESTKNDITTQNFDSLGELLAVKNPQSKLDYLLLTAYYLQIKEDLFKYSLKQLNSKAMPFLGSLIDHSIIHNAVAHDFIEVVPDYNGTAEVTEYRLTLVGENYLLNEL